MILRIETKLTISSTAMQTPIQEANQYLSIPLHDMKRIKVYRLQYEAESIALELLKEQASEILADPIMETCHFQDWNPAQSDEKKASPSYVVECQYRAGVTDNIARTAEEAFSILGTQCTVATATLSLLYGEISREQAIRIGTELLGNTLIQDIQIYSWQEFLILNRFDAVSFPEVKLEAQTSLYQVFDASLPKETWNTWSVDNCWALSLEEIEHIQSYFQNSDVQKHRTQIGLPAQPTDVEVEVIAQSWSEHCKHKIFAADVDYQEGEFGDEYTRLGNLKISSLFKTFIKSATTEIEQEREIPWLRSVFHDNAGVVDFDPYIDLAIKVETHNSPSALDPYGGAITGILGVNRDILGVGMGAKPIGNMDVFCFADPKWPLDGDQDLMPVGLKQPRRLLEGVHKGVEDGGNTSGIPTINGAIFFDQDYAGKPLVFVGTVGIMPKVLPNGVSGVQKEIGVGDFIYMVGGAIGADGIHGATFSSLELNENSPATAVQIGDPITQKRTMDFLLEARDLGLFSCLTDNGAGGLSSSVGEMAILSGGARLDLAKAPTKYPNLKPWELMISESQERMTFSVPPASSQAFEDLAKRRGVLAMNLGEFTDSGDLEVYYGSELVGLLNLDFLHESLPAMKIPARWNGPMERRSWIQRDGRIASDQASQTEKLYTLLASPNIVSKERWVRQYDHEVQGATHIKPFGGSTQKGPNDSGVLWLYPHGGAKESTVCVGCGLQPRISLYDPYLMAQYAVDEAVRNVVATGGDIDNTCILDNFCWPDPVQSKKTPDGDLKMGQLVRTCKGLYDIAKTYGTPLVSGKDSMKNDFRGRNGKGEPLTISILPTLLVTAMSKGSLTRSQSSSFKNSGDIIYWIGNRDAGLAASEYAEHFHIDAKDDYVAPVNLETNLSVYRKLKEVMELGLIASIHDCSDGGVLCALAESCFGEMLGIKIDLPDLSDVTCFAEGTGQFVISVPEDSAQKFEKLWQGLPFLPLGQVKLTPRFIVNQNIDEDISDLLTAWTREL